MCFGNYLTQMSEKERFSRRWIWKMISAAQRLFGLEWEIFQLHSPLREDFDIMASRAKK